MTASEPTRPDLSTWHHNALHRRVRDALSAVPAQFATEIFISGVLATDLHTLNSALGAAIEEQVVATLNAMRATWDPDDNYALYSFVRQPQTFPDVLLRRAPSADDARSPRVATTSRYRAAQPAGVAALPRVTSTGWGTY